MAARVVVDGNNVIGSRPDGWWKDRAGAARRLVERLGAWAEATQQDVLVVFDGGRPGEDQRTLVPADGGRRGELAVPARVEVRYAERAGRDAADDVIAALVAADAAPEALRVVTSDAELTRRVRAHGAAVTGALGFRDELDRA